MSTLLQNAKEATSFLLVCTFIVAALIALPLAVEKLVLHRQQRLASAKSVAFIAMFGAIAAVLMFLEFPLFFAPPFYEIDLSEIPAMICAFYLGPVAGVLCEFLKIVLKLLLKGTSTLFVGDFANFVVGCSMVLPASIVYHIKKSKRSAVIGLIVGTLCMTIFGSAFNAVYLLPKFAQLYNMPLDALVAMGTEVNKSITSVSTLVLFAVVPFNILKGIVVSIITMLLYKRVGRLLHS